MEFEFEMRISMFFEGRGRRRRHLKRNGMDRIEKKSNENFGKILRIFGNKLQKKFSGGFDLLESSQSNLPENFWKFSKFRIPVAAQRPFVRFGFGFEFEFFAPNAENFSFYQKSNGRNFFRRFYQNRRQFVSERRGFFDRKKGLRRRRNFGTSGRNGGKFLRFLANRLEKFFRRGSRDFLRGRLSEF